MSFRMCGGCSGRIRGGIAGKRFGSFAARIGRKRPSILSGSRYTESEEISSGPRDLSGYG